MFGLQRDSKRHHGHHLTPQDADADRTRRGRHKTSLGDNGRTHNPPIRGYRSDDEPRRRHRHDGDKDRHRASSSHHPKDHDRRKQDSSSDTEDDLVPAIIEVERKRTRSNRKPCGEHRFDDFLDERRHNPAPKQTSSGSSIPPSVSTSQARIRLDELDSRSSSSGHNQAFNVNAKLPRLSISPYPTAYSQIRPNIEIPGESNSGVGEDWHRPRAASAASTPSSRILSWASSSPSSGILGPKTYQYQSLQPAEIRLVKILPETMSKLRCEITHTSLQSLPEYTAISVSHCHSLATSTNIELAKYAWGDGIDTTSLIVEGAAIPVAVSLYDALRAVRRKKEDIFVWVDALCIDQQNRDERATQVRLMGQIYSGAVSVAIWIGPEHDESALALELLHSVAENSIDSQHIRSTRNPDSLALLNLFKRDYWKRLWGN